jgi:hypothetical protein
MSKVIQVLAEMASDSNLQNDAAIDALLISNEINSEQSTAIITKNITSLERQLDICPDFVCMVVPAEDDENETQEDDKSTEESTNAVISL